MKSGKSTNRTASKLFPLFLLAFVVIIVFHNSLSSKPTNRSSKKFSSVDDFPGDNEEANLTGKVLELVEKYKNLEKKHLDAIKEFTKQKSGLEAEIRELRVNVKHDSELEQPDPSTFQYASKHPIDYRVPFTNFIIEKRIFFKDLVDKASIFLLRKPHDKKIVKIIPYRRKTNVENEVRLLRYTSSLNLSPSVYSVTYHTNYTYVVMDHVQGSNLADIHGRIILNNTWFITNLKETHAEVCKILRFLANHGIVYPDRSAWQFIRVADGRLVLLDMEHAEKSTKEAAHAELQLIDTVPWNPLFV